MAPTDQRMSDSAWLWRVVTLKSPLGAARHSLTFSLSRYQTIAAKLRDTFVTLNSCKFLSENLSDGPHIFTAPGNRI